MDDERKVLYVYYVLISGFIFIMLLVFVNKASDDTLYKQKVKTADLSLIYDAILSSTGDLEVKEGVKGYLVELGDKCTFSVTDIKEKKIRSYYNCVADNNIGIPKSFELQEEINFKKEQNTIVIS